MKCEESNNKKSGHRLWRLQVYLTWVRLQTRYMHWGGRHWQTANLSFPSKLAKVAIFLDVWSLPSPIFPVSRLGLSSETIFAITIITRVLLRTTASGVYDIVGLCETVNHTSWRFMIGFHSCIYGIHIPYTAERWDILGNTPPEDQKDREIPRDLHH